MCEQFAYYLKAYADRMTLTIVSSSAEDHTGISDGETEILYVASFFSREKVIYVECNVYGNLDMWLAMIREGKVRHIGVEENLQEIRKVFPVVQEVFNLEMFAHIYRTKGLKFNPMIQLGQEKEYFTLQKEKLPEDITGDDAVIRTRLHKLPDENLLLEIDVALYHGKRHAQLLISEDYVYSEELLELSYMFYLEDIVVGESTEADINAFSQRYPSSGLAEYWKNNGRNILLPLLSSNYHKGIELLSKSGCVGEAGKVEDYELFKDYLHICSLINEYPGGLTPRNLTWSHDIALEMVRETENKKHADEFRFQVLESSYTELITESGPDSHFFENDQYMIMAPKRIEDLVQESIGMHNCVRIYSVRVASGDTKIYMMGRRQNPDVSFVTIQVDGNRIVQVKAAYSKLADEDAQSFIRKWASIKKLRIDTSDIRRTA